MPTTIPAISPPDRPPAFPLDTETVVVVAAGVFVSMEPVGEEVPVV